MMVLCGFQVRQSWPQMVPEISLEATARFSGQLFVSYVAFQATNKKDGIDVRRKYIEIEGMVEEKAQRETTES